MNPKKGEWVKLSTAYKHKNLHHAVGYVVHLFPESSTFVVQLEFYSFPDGQIKEISWDRRQAWIFKAEQAIPLSNTDYAYIFLKERRVEDDE